MENILELLKKFDIPTPRYTSYPTVPYWEHDTMNADVWQQSVINRFKNEKGELSIYIHLPFCENLCTFCACNKRITTNHKVESPYIATVLKEWKMYRDFLLSKPIIREIHLGGGTPTFFSPEHLTELIQGITKNAEVSADHEFSVEVHPNYTTYEHLKALADVGFNRISLGVQDFDTQVQYVINRIQSFEKTSEVVDWARQLNYNSINIDLVYGLPKQTVASVEHTIANIKQLMPNRIAFYSYAHVPWKSKVQRRYSDDDVPKANEKWAMYHTGRKLLLDAGFDAIGMDHFALPDDKMFAAAKEGNLHRNFMGYTTTQTKLIIGLGASSISDSWDGFIQNEKEVEAYEEKIAAGIFPIIAGHKLNAEDEMIRKNILELMCNDETTLLPELFDATLFDEMKVKLNQLMEDDLAELINNKIVVKEKGKLFVRIIAASIDARLLRKQSTGNTFSKAI
ncbi:MAG: oxygen-independent coproporphyrinogen oxidase [Bacteroidota bacterium]|jgi:oxygen-independent coproporphyrinogen-3 oxidase